MNKVIFVDGDGISRAPMAAGILKRNMEKERLPVKVLARGLVVSFPQPLNQKTETVMISEGLDVSDYQAVRFDGNEVDRETLVIAMDSQVKRKMLSDYPDFFRANCFSFAEYIGDELEIMDPYGGSLRTYGLCFEVVKASVTKLLDKIRWEV